MIYQYLVGFFTTNEYYNNTGEMYCRPNMVKHEILVKYDLFYQYIWFWYIILQKYWLDIGFEIYVWWTAQ